jgi:hypothetical protein
MKNKPNINNPPISGFSPTPPNKPIPIAKNYSVFIYSFQS